MKSIKLYLTVAVMAVLAVGAVSCSDDFDVPPTNIPVATKQANTTIAELKDLYWQSGVNYVTPITTKVDADGQTVDVIIKGNVISSDAAGNIYKQLYIQDATGAICLSIDASSMYTTYRVGQEIVLDLKDLYAGKYAGLMQIGIPSATNSSECGRMSQALFEQDVELNNLPNPANIDTTTIKISELPTDDAGVRAMQSKLVRIDNVSWQDAGSTFCEPKNTSGDYNNTSRNIVDSNGNTIIVRNSGYANFKAEILPAGVGSVVGILSYYSTGSNGTWQILLRSTSDLIDFAAEKGTVTNPYSVEDAIALVGENKEAWVDGYIVGAVAPGVVSVSSNSDIQWEASVALANTIVIAPAADVKDIAKCMIIALPDGSALRNAANLVDNASVYGKLIKLKGTITKSEKTYNQAGIVTAGADNTFELDGVTPPTPGGEGDGSQTSPFSVSQILAGSTGTGVWTSGYIVGWVDGMTLSSGAKFTVPATSQSNILIAETAGETDYTKCVPVQLPSGDVRTALNLVTNTGNLGKKVSVKADAVAYFGTKGLKNTSEYSLEGGVTPPVVVDPVTSLSENFQSQSLPAGWATYKVTGDKNWYYTSFTDKTTSVTDYYAAMTGYKGTTPPFDAWIVTCPLNVKDAATKILSFDNQVNGYGSTTTVFEVYVMNAQNPSEATSKTKLSPTLAVAPASGNSGWVNSGNLDLSAYGNTVYVGFRFHATTDANYATWCITNVNFGK